MYLYVRRFTGQWLTRTEPVVVSGVLMRLYSLNMPVLRAVHPVPVLRTRVPNKPVIAVRPAQTVRGVVQIDKCSPLNRRRAVHMDWDDAE